METGTFPPPWARGGFISAGLVAVTQRRESCWGLSPPQGLPGRGPCHTLLVGGLFSELGWPGIQPAPLCPLGPSGHQCSCPLWSLMLVFPVSLWSPMLLSPVSLWSLMLLSHHQCCCPLLCLWSPHQCSCHLCLTGHQCFCPLLSLWSPKPLSPLIPLVMRLDLCHGAQPAARGHRPLWGPPTKHP